MTRVLINLLSPRADFRSGIVAYALRIVDALISRAQFEYSVITNLSDRLLGEILNLSSVQVVRGQGIKSETLHYPYATWQVARAAYALKAEVVFTPWPSAPAVGGGRRVMVMHDLYRKTNPELFAWRHRASWDAITPIAVAAADKVVCVSRTTAELFAEFYPRAAHKAVVVYEDSTIRSEADTVSPCKLPYGLIVSSSAANKNIEGLVRALDLMDSTQVGEFRLFWVGRDDNGQINSLLARHPRAMAVFRNIERATEKQLATLYAHAAFYVAPSFMEGFCLPVVEAQKFGVPTLVADIPVLREVAGAGALCFDPVSSAEIARAIEAVMTKKALRTSLSANALANAARFDWNTSAEQLERIFR